MRHARIELPLDWSPRFYEDADAEQSASVLQAAFDGWPKVETTVSAVDHLRWKMASHPKSARLCMVGEVSGRLVASQCYWLQRIKVASSSCLPARAWTSASTRMLGG